MVTSRILFTAKQKRISSGATLQSCGGIEA